MSFKKLKLGPIPLSITMFYNAKRSFSISKARSGTGSAGLVFEDRFIEVGKLFCCAVGAVEFGGGSLAGFPHALPQKLAFEQKADFFRQRDSVPGCCCKSGGNDRYAGEVLS